MPKGRPKSKLTENIEKMITKIQSDRVKKGEPKLKAPAMRKELLKTYMLMFRKKGLSEEDISKKYKLYEEKILPGNSSIQGFLRRVVNPLLDKTHFEETPWSIGKTPELSAEAVAVVISVQQWMQQYYREGHGENLDKYIADLRSRFKKWLSNSSIVEKLLPESGHLPTVREARWIARLHAITVREYYASEEERERAWHNLGIPDKMRLEDFTLWCAAKMYSDYERISILAGIIEEGGPLDTSILDWNLRNINLLTDEYLFDITHEEVHNEGTYSTTEQEKGNLVDSDRAGKRRRRKAPPAVDNGEG